MESVKRSEVESVQNGFMQIAEFPVAWTDSTGATKRLTSLRTARRRRRLAGAAGVPVIRTTDTQSPWAASRLPTPNLLMLSYTYDFGDCWEHRLTVEKVLPAQELPRYAVCVAGANACPPEDVGGPPGYVHFLDALSDPQHPEHQELLAWCGGAFDPRAFDLAQANARLQHIKL